MWDHTAAEWRRGIGALGLLLMMMACGGGEELDPPSETELRIFTDVFLIEAALQDFSGPTKDTLTERYYGQLYDRYGLSAGELDGLRRRYNETPELWGTLSDSLEARLNRSQADPSDLLR